VSGLRVTVVTRKPDTNSSVVSSWQFISTYCRRCTVKTTSNNCLNYLKFISICYNRIDLQFIYNSTYIRKKWSTLHSPQKYQYTEKTDLMNSIKIDTYVARILKLYSRVSQTFLLADHFWLRKLMTDPYI
jgi:hypothetical protein